MRTDFQTRRQAPALLERACRAEADGDLGKAQEALALYLNLRREDGPAWAWYARLVDRRDPDGLRRGRVYLIRAEALRHNPGDAALSTRQCAELALELGRYGDALSYLTGLLNRLGKDARGRAASELEELLGRCLRGQSRYDEAAHAFRRAIERDPARSSCYAHLARLLRVDLRRDEEADAAIRAMVERNPESALAYIGRWRYAQEFAPPGDPGDVRRALELGPDNPEVRIAAAIASEQGQDPAGREPTGRRAGRSTPAIPPWPSAWPAWRCARDISIAPRRSCGEPIRSIPPSASPSSWPRS